MLLRCPLELDLLQGLWQLLRTSVAGVLKTLLWFCSTPWLLPSLLHKLVWCLHWGVGVVEVVLLSRSWELLSSPGLVVVHCCHAHSVQAQIPMLRRTLQSCCQIFVWEVLWGIQILLVRTGSCHWRLRGPWRLGVACKPLLLRRRRWCWWECIWGYLGLFAQLCPLLSFFKCCSAPSSSASVSTVVALSALASICGKMLSCRPMYAENLHFHSSNVA